MARIHVTHHIGDLASDLETIRVEAPRKMRSLVNEGAKAGNQIAARNAKRSAGKHGKHYHKAFTWEPTHTAPNTYSAEYGPDSARPQGGMSFEYGSRNQPPHLDLARSADVIQHIFPEKVSEMVDDLFWPGA